jgi:peptide/nickel transport system permease protein
MTDAAAPASVSATADASIAASRQADRRRTLRLLSRSPTFLVGAAVLAFWVFCAFFGAAIAPYDPLAQDLLATVEPPSARHWFGTDQLGRDVFSRVLVGARDILTIAPIATLISTVLGTALGLVMGYYGGWVDQVISRIIEAILSLPLLVVALLALVAVGASSWTVVGVIGLSFAPIIGRTVRAAAMQEAELDYVMAAKLRRESGPYIMFVEMLPNILPPILVEMTVRLGYAIFTVATLSFIGFGIQPPSPDWGLSISSNYGLVTAGFWWTVLFDAVAIASLVVAVNLVADGVQEAVNG